MIISLSLIWNTANKFLTIVCNFTAYLITIIYLFCTLAKLFSYFIYFGYVFGCTNTSLAFRIFFGCTLADDYRCKHSFGYICFWKQLLENNKQCRLLYVLYRYFSQSDFSHGSFIPHFRRIWSKRSRSLL